MSDPDDFDVLLKEQFDREHQHVPAEPFIAATTRRMRVESRYADGIRTATWVAALVAAVLASPWLIAGATRLNAVLASSLSWAADLPGMWLLGVLAVAAVLWSRVRSH
jgi:hypothetical protein